VAGYDELTTGEIDAVIAEADDERVRDVAAYERAHKNRVGVLRKMEQRIAV